MTTSVELNDAMGALSQALDARENDANGNPAVYPHWFGTSQACSAVLGRAEDWYALPDESSDFDDPRDQADDASTQVDSAGSTDDWRDALNAADAAIAAVNALL
jgi:hypothetical protein